MSKKTLWVLACFLVGIGALEIASGIGTDRWQWVGLGTVLTLLGFYINPYKEHA